MAAAVVGMAIIGLTTYPWRFAAGQAWESCIVCGSAGGADAVLNVLLFVPFGFLLARAGLPWWWCMALAVAGSALIETVQSYQPQRYATPGDVITNTLGANAGVALAVLGPGLLRWTDSVGWPAGAVLAAPGALILIATAWLLQTSLPVSTWYGQWAPDLGHFARFPGAVTAARVGNVPVPAGRRGDSEALRARLLRGDPVVVHARLDGPRPAKPAPVFSIFDGQQREVLFLGVAGDDGVARIRRRAAEARLHWPFQAAPDLFAGTEPGHEGVYAWTERWDGECLDWGGRRACGIREPVSRGWAFVVPVYLGARAWLADALWLALLFAPLGCARRGRTAMFGAFLLIILTVALPPLTGVGAVAAASWAVTGVVSAAAYLMIGRARSSSTH